MQKARREMTQNETREVGSQGINSVKDLVLILEAIKSCSIVLRRETL